MTANKFTVPHHLFRGNLKEDESEYLASARAILARLPEKLSLDGLADSAILDVGCGTKFTQALLDDGIAVDRYVGVDVYKPLVDYLAKHVTDPRFSYHHMNTHNAMYNTTGVPLTDSTRIPIGDEKFDIICLFSVFTHLAPHDYPNMLKMLRRHISEGGRLIYTLFIDEVTPGGHGLLDKVCRQMSVEWSPNGQRFFDARPETPLKTAVYARDYAFELIEDTGWEVLSLSPPERYMQHHFICAPI